MLAISKLNSIETILSQALIDTEISQEKYFTIINEDEKQRRLKKDTRIMESQISDAEKDKLIEKERRYGISQIVH